VAKKRAQFTNRRFMIRWVQTARIVAYLSTDYIQ